MFARDIFSRRLRQFGATALLLLLGFAGAAQADQVTDKAVAWLISKQATSAPSAGAFQWNPAELDVYPNTQGATALGLLRAYERTGNLDALNAAIANGDCQLAGDSCISGLEFSGERHHFAAHDPLFLIELSRDTGNTAYADLVTSDMWDRLTAGSYGEAQDQDAAGYVAALMAARASTPELAAWDLSKLAIAAHVAGQDDIRDTLMDGVLQSLEASDASHTTYDVVGLAGAVWASALTGINLDPTAGKWAAASNTAGLAAMLVNYQAPGGGFITDSSNAVADANAEAQTTSFAMQALDAVDGTLYQSQIAAGFNSITASQDGDGHFGASYVEDQGEITEAYASIMLRPTTVYVDDDYAGNTVGASESFTHPLVNGGSSILVTYGQDAFATITEALANVASGGTVYVAAGTYAEADGFGNNLVIGKAVSIFGAQAGVDARNRSDAGASVIVPAVANAAMTYETAAEYGVVAIWSDGVTLDGFVIDGDNPGISTGLPMGTADPDVDSGIWASGSNIHVDHNVIRNLVYVGFDGYDFPASIPASQGNTLKQNWIHNIDAPSEWGIGVILEWNYYADVEENLIDDVRIGIQTNYFFKAAPVPADAVISSNEVHASLSGIYHNYFTTGSSPFTLADNHIYANDNASASGLWVGFILQGLYNDSTAIVQGNQVDGSALAGSGRERAGYRVNLITTSEASNTAITGGDVSHVDYGVLVTDGAFYPGNVDDINVADIDFNDVSLAAFYVEDTALAGSETVDNAPRVTIGSGMSYTDVAQQGALAGPQATIAYASGAPMLESILVRGANGGHRDGLEDSNDNVRHVENALINSGIADVAIGGSVTVGEGTFDENVNVTRSLTLRGTFAGTPGYDASRDGTGEAVISPASGVAVKLSAADTTVDGLTIGSGGGHAIQRNAGSVANNLHVINNRIENVVNGTGVFSEPGSSATTSGFEIAHNLFGSISGSGSSAGRGVVLFKGTSDATVNDNEFVGPFGAYGMQLNGGSGAVTDVAITGNRISGSTSNAVIITHTSGVTFERNTVTGVPQALFISDNTTDFTASCNVLSATGTGVSSNDFFSGAANSNIRIFDNAISGGSADINNGMAQGLVVGSNWYDGGTPTLTGSSLQVADALPADPTNGGAFDVTACGDNTPTQIVAYAGTPQSTPINAAFTQPLVARVQDALGGAVLAPQSVTFAAPASGASAVLGTSSGTTDFNGTVSTTATANGLAGSYDVTATSGSFTTSPGFALTNGKGTGTVVGDTTSFVYNGGNFTPTAHIQEEAGATCTFTPPSVGPNVGTYPVTATCESANYVASGTIVVSITPATASLSLSHLVQAYDGAPKSVLVTTTPAGVGYSVSYVGTGSTVYGPSTQAPTEEGTYTATASVDDANYTGSDASGTLQIVQGSGDIALVVNGPVDPIHVGDTAQFAATMLANPDLHQGEKFAYEIVLSKSNGDTPLDISDIASMEVFYGGSWVDVATLTGSSLPFTMDGSGNLVYTFPDGIPGYTGGFPILDPSWTWNVRFSFATRGTYTSSWTLEDGATLDPVTPAVQGSAAVVVQDALPPTDIHLVLGGPAENVQANTPAEYTGTMLADPTLHAGESYFVRVTVAKSGGTHALDPSDLESVKIYYGGSWQSLPPGAFALDGDGNLVYDFPQPAEPGGFEIQDPEWTWNFQITYADIGTYTATAEVIHADEASDPTPQVFASDAISTTVIPQVVVPPSMNLLLLGPVDDVAVGAPAEYTGTLLANPADFTGRTFWVRVRFSRNGGTEAMTAADLQKIELYNGGWMDATGAIVGQLQTDGNDLVYLFPKPQGAFEIDEAQWTWHARFSYASEGVYTITADVVDAAEADPMTAPSLADTTTDTNVVPMAADLALSLQGPISGTQTGVATAFAAELTNDGGDLDENALVKFRISRAGGSMTAGDLALEYYDGAGYLPLPLATCSDDAAMLCGDFGPGGGFPVGAGYDATTLLRATFATADTYTVQADVVGAPSGDVLASDTLVTQVVPHDIITAQVLIDPVSLHAVYDGSPHAASVTTDPPGLAYEVTYDGSNVAPTDAGVYDVEATIVEPGYAGSASAVLVIDKAPSTVTIDAADLGQVYGLTHAVDASASPISGTGQVVVTYDGSATVPSNAGSYTVVATLDDPNYTGSASATLDIAPAPVVFTLDDLAQTYDGTAKQAGVTTNPGGIAFTITYDGSASAPTDAGSYTVVVVSGDPNYAGMASGTLVIAKAVATVTLSDLVQTFDGSQKTVTATTDPAGLAVTITYDGAAAGPSAVGSYTVVATVVDDNYTGSASGTLQIVEAGAPNLAVSIDDDRDYVQYGKLLTYRITVNNTGNTDISGATVAAVLPQTLLAATPGWTCVPIGTATCGSGGNGDLADSADIPAGGGVVYLLNAWAKDDQSLTTDEIVMQAAVTAAGDVDSSDDSATDTTTMVLFRDGFEEGGDGAQPIATVSGQVRLGHIDASHLQLIDLRGAWASNGNLVEVASVSAGADRLQLQAIRVGETLQVRLVGEAAGTVYLGAWTPVAAGTAQLAVSIADVDGNNVLLMVGASQDLEVTLSGTSTTLSVDGVPPSDS